MANSLAAALAAQLQRDLEKDQPQAVALASQLSKDKCDTPKESTWCFNCGGKIPADMERMDHECWTS